MDMSRHRVFWITTLDSQLDQKKHIPSQGVGEVPLDGFSQSIWDNIELEVFFFC